ncbi:MAG TPA: TonB-dependent receptor [Allosphingosinicella sp.]
MASTLIFGAAAFATPAWAQPTDDDTQENATSSQPDTTGNSDLQEGQANEERGDAIVVTGSRIQRRDLTSTSPLAVIQDEEFTLSGATNVEQVMNQLPQVVPATTGFSNNPGGGVATLDLRGIGTNRSLVLVNGRRWMFFDTSQVVDLNTIPQFLIDSVDLVTGGASAVYGSDAISGVVNFRLQTDLDGIQAGGQYAITEEGDGRRYGAHLAVGSQLADGRGHVVAFGEYYNRESIFAGDRAYSRFSTDQNSGIDVCVDPATINPSTGVGTPLGTIIQPGATSGTPGTCASGVPGLAAAGSGTNQFGRFRYTGAGVAAAGPYAGSGGGTGAQIDIPGQSGRAFNALLDAYNFAPENYLMVPQERWLLGGYGEFEIDENVSLFTEVTYVNNRVTTQLAATPVTGIFNFNVAQNCAFVSAADCARFQQIEALEVAAAAVPGGPANTPGVIALNTSRRTLETGPRGNQDERNAFRVLAGVRGPITDTLNYEAYYSFARTRNSQFQTGGVSRSSFQEGLDGTADPINIFGPGTLTQAMLDQFIVSASNTDISTLQVATASINGVLGNFGMGADDIGFAAGVEWRSVSANYLPDPVSASGDIIGPNFGLPTSGGYNVREAFAELRVPLLADRPGFHRLELNGAARYSDYSLPAVGGVWTYAAGAEWAPVPDITFRGQYQRAIRAPNVGELFGGQFNSFPAASDPCAGEDAITDTTIRTLCIQTGVPAAVLAFGPDGSDPGTAPDPLNANLQSNAQIEALFGGNAALQEEQSDTFTLGVVIRPRFIPRLNIAIDAYDIRIDNAITTFGGGLNNVLNLCYNVLQDLTSQYCQTFIGARNPATGEIEDPFLPLLLNANSAKLETRGIDFAVDYSQPLSFSLVGGEESRLNFSFMGTYLDRYRFSPAPEDPTLVTPCEGLFGAAFCDDPYARWKWTTRLSLVDGPMTLSGRWRHISAVEDDDESTIYTFERIGSYDLFDLSMAFDVSDGLRLALGVNNLLDRQPPQLGTNAEQSNTYPGTYDPLGRDFFISANLRF